MVISSGRLKERLTVDHDHPEWRWRLMPWSRLMPTIDELTMTDGDGGMTMRISAQHQYISDLSHLSQSSSSHVDSYGWRPGRGRVQVLQPGSSQARPGQVGTEWWTLIQPVQLTTVFFSFLQPLVQYSTVQATGDRRQVLNVVNLFLISRQRRSELREDRSPTLIVDLRSTTILINWSNRSMDRTADGGRILMTSRCSSSPHLSRQLMPAHG